MKMSEHIVLPVRALQDAVDEVWYILDADHKIICGGIKSEQLAQAIAHAINQHPDLVEMLKKHQWSDCYVDWGAFDVSDRCPECLGFVDDNGHFPDCALNALLKKEEE